MGDTFECPYCEEEGAYFNGVEYECPSCDKIWNPDINEGLEEFQGYSVKVARNSPKVGSLGSSPSIPALK